MALVGPHTQPHTQSVIVPSSANVSLGRKGLKVSLKKTLKQVLGKVVLPIDAAGV